MRTLFTTIGAIVLAFGLVTGAPPARAQQAPQAPVQLPDDSLTCEQLTAESLALQNEMNAMTAELQGAASAQIRAARQAQAASTATSIASGLASQIPFIGGLIGSLASRATRAPVEAQQDRMLELSERMMTRGAEIGQRMQRVEILRSARCGTGQGQSQGQTIAQSAPLSPDGSDAAPDQAGN